MLILVLSLVALLALAGCGGEDGENGDMGGQAAAAPFLSSNVMHGTFDGVHEALTLERRETFAGLLGDTEIAATFDETAGMFTGRVRNEASVAVCDVHVAVVLDPDMASETALDVPQIAGLSVGGRSSFDLPAGGMSFSHWTVQVDTDTCASAPAGGAPGERPEGEGAGEHGGSGGEGGGEHGGAGGEGSGEHGAGGEGSEGGGEGGGESGEEANPSIPIGDTYTGTTPGGQTFDFRYEADTGLFRGTVENTSAALICDSRTEIHLGTPMGVVELGPTIREDLDPGDVLYVVMYQDGPEPDTYILHPEASSCP